MSGERYNAGERTKSPDELAAEAAADKIKSATAEHYANSATSLLRSGVPGQRDVQLPRFADGRVVPATSIPYLIAEAAAKGYTSGRWLDRDDLEFLGVTPDQLKGEPTHLLSFDNKVWEGQRDENGQLVPNTEYGGYNRESRELGDDRRALATPVWNLSQTPLSDVPRTEPRERPTAVNLWTEFAAAFKALDIDVTAHGVSDVADCRVTRIPDDYAPRGAEDPMQPGRLIVGLHGDLDPDHVIYFAMDALDAGLDAKETRDNRRRGFGDETEARLRLATAVASLALQERLPASYPSRGDANLERWEAYLQDKSPEDRGRIFSYAVTSQKGRGALNNLFEGQLVPRGRDYRGESLFPDGDRQGPTPAWSDTFDPDWARRNLGFEDSETAPEPAAEAASAPAEAAEPYF